MTLADEDSNSIPTDDVNRVFLVFLIATIFPEKGGGGSKAVRKFSGYSSIFEKTGFPYPKLGLETGFVMGTTYIGAGAMDP